MTTRARFTVNALILLLLALTLAPAACAQESDAPKVEIGVQYSSLSITLPGFGGTENAAGIGGRVTYNLNDYFAVEAEGNVFPTGTQSRYTTGGAAEQVQAGVKVGRRFNRFGIFAKARPGFVSFGNTVLPTEVSSGAATFFSFEHERKTHFSMDVGGVLEFYPSRRMLVRFDAGDTIIRYGEHAELATLVALVPHDEQPIVAAPAETKHSFQFSGGIGFRFGGDGKDEGAAAEDTSSTHERRFELGAQFSSLLLRPPASTSGGVFLTSGVDEGSQAEAGGGARLGFNATDNLAFEVEGNFYPRRRLNINTAVGGYPSQLQAGVKYGRRFNRFGIFAKARPGFVNFSSVSEVTSFEPFTSGGLTFFIPQFRERSKTYFSMDVGGVVEFYPTSRVFTRFDAGDTMIRYTERGVSDVTLTPTPPRLPAELRHNLQVTAGIGFRF